MPNNEDYFSDVKEEVLGRDFGSLGGEGMDYHDSAKSHVAKEGVNTRIRCEQCGMTNVLTAEWPEIVILSQHRLPPNWMLVKGNALPNIGCRSGGCRAILRVGFTPDEATKHLKAGLAANMISEEWLQSAIQQLRSGGGAAPARR